jgi:phosphate/sulfate permease
MRTACIFGAILEFTGALVLGSNTVDTIRGKIIKSSLFVKDPYVLFLGLFCALVATSYWDITASAYGLPGRPSILTVCELKFSLDYSLCRWFHAWSRYFRVRRQ